QNLPHYGTLYGNGKPVSEEELLAADPQLILLMGELTESFKERANELSDRFSIPVVLFDNGLEALPEAYRLMGEICGREERAGELGHYCEGVLERAERITDSIPPEDRKRVFYSLGTDGLKTYPVKTTVSDYIELCGALNVVNVPYKKITGHVSVSFEELLTWNPEYILAGSFANSPANSGSIYHQGKWKALNSEIELIPYIPFDAFAKPPSVNRLGGILWLQDLLYPDLTDYDSEEELKEFNRLFYGIESEGELP
ncbi:MAG: ABC transporter substrate-binding protein, partial [Spirochaetales bacterium]|nr:ABC transporter substrate-binding protein [Spirochaetales bacterium]